MPASEDIAIGIAVVLLLASFLFLPPIHIRLPVTCAPTAQHDGI